MDGINEEELIAKINHLREKTMRDLLDDMPNAVDSLEEYRKFAEKRLSSSYHTTLREMMGVVKLYNQHFENGYMRALEEGLSMIFRRVEEAL